MPLTDIRVKAAKAREKDYKLSDEKGLFLLVAKTGHKRWRLKYRVDGKEKLLAIRVYPDVSLSRAREERDKARSLLAQGVDPMAHKKAAKIARQEASTNSFELVAREWLENRGPKSETGDARLRRILEKDLFPTIGNLPVTEITPPVLLQALRKIEERGAIETAHKAKQYAGQVFRYAVGTGRVERDPAADLKGVLKSPKKKHFAAITKPDEAGALMRAIHGYQGTPAVAAALKLAPLVFCRPGELRQLEWEEVNFNESRIELPAHKMKIREPHIIPLASQAVEILKEVQGHSWKSRFVFPNGKTLARPLSENGIRAALRTMGYSNEQMTAHGFRAMARTLLDEVLNFPVDWIEHQLAHAVKDANGRAYNRTRHLESRRKMMQAWADYLDSLREGNAKVVALKTA